MDNDTPISVEAFAEETGGYLPWLAVLECIVTEYGALVLAMVYAHYPSEAFDKLHRVYVHASREVIYWG